MKSLRRFFHRLFHSATGRAEEERLREEIAEHIALQTEQNLRAGYHLSRHGAKPCSSLAAWRP